MSEELLAELQDCNLKMAAFGIAKTIGGGVYKKELVAAFDLFTKVPCPETGVQLVYVCHETLALMKIEDDRFVRMTPKEFRGPRYDGIDE